MSEARKPSREDLEFKQFMASTLESSVTPPDIELKTIDEHELIQGNSVRGDIEPRKAGAFVQPKKELPGIEYAIPTYRPDNMPSHIKGRFLTLEELQAFAQLWFNIGDMRRGMVFSKEWKKEYGDK